MNSIKKIEKHNLAPKEEPRVDLELTFETYTQEIKRLESAYSQLQSQFYTLKQSLETSHQRLEKIISHLSEGLLFVEKTGLITLINPAALALLRQSASSILNTSYWNTFSDTLFGFSMKKALEDEDLPWRVVLTLNEQAEVQVSTSIVPDHGILLLFTDRSEQQKLETTLFHASRLKALGEMAATLAHEIRNPLGGIEGFAHLLQRDLKEDSHQKMLGHIIEGTRTLNHLVTNVLEYARPKKFHFAPTDLVSLIRESLDFTSANFKTSLLTFESDYETCIVSIDRARIGLVLLNLFRNALESKASKIHVELKKEHQLIIKDNGEGIAQKNLEKIFTPFFTTKATGTGLGLAEAHSVIEAHGGEIEVRSEEKKGTQFFIKFIGTNAH